MQHPKFFHFHQKKDQGYSRTADFYNNTLDSKFCCYLFSLSYFLSSFYMWSNHCVSFSLSFIFIPTIFFLSKTFFLIHPQLEMYHNSALYCRVFISYIHIMWTYTILLLHQPKIKDSQLEEHCHFLPREISLKLVGIDKIKEEKIKKNNQLVIPFSLQNVRKQKGKVSWVEWEHSGWWW